MTENPAVEEEFDPNEIKDPALAIEEPEPFNPADLGQMQEDIRNSPEFQNAMRNAQRKQYDHTFFEIFEDQISGIIVATEAPLTVEVADSIMRTWPWFKYTDIETYITYRVRMLKELLADLHAAFPKPPELLFQENVDDWQNHREGYMELMVLWTARNNRWTREWQALKLGNRMKAVLHPVIADMTYLTMGPEGMIEKFQYLVDFDNPDYVITDKESEKMQARIKELSDE